MTDMPKAARERLAEALLPQLLTAVRHLDCDDGTTRKTVWRLFDGAHVECVLMRYPGPGHDVRLLAGRLRHELPVLRHRAGRPRPATCRPPRSSTRSSPARGCCATARSPAARPGVSNVVFMGMGEPLANYKRGRRRRPPAHRPARRTASGCRSAASPCRTVGLVPAMRQARRRGPSGARLAVSLHAPDDELRDTLVPVNTRWKVAEVLDAALALRRASPAAGSPSSTR